MDNGAVGLRNIQDIDVDDAALGAILQTSTHTWLNNAEMTSLFLSNELFLPLSDTLPNDYTEGLFLFWANKYTDNLIWTDVEQERRRNCTSQKLHGISNINYTRASVPLEGGVTFRRRTHHFRDDYGYLAVVHYLAFGPAANEEADDDADDPEDAEDQEDHLQVADDLQDADGGFEEDEESESDVSVDSQIEDPNYSPHDNHSLGQQTNRSQEMVSDKSQQTRKLREADEAARRVKLTKAVICVRFPDNHTFEATFLHLFKRMLSHPDTAFCLYTTPPKQQINDFSQDFCAAGFIPGAILYFANDVPKTDGGSSTPYLSEEILSLKDAEVTTKAEEPVEPSSEPALTDTVPAEQEPKPTEKQSAKPKWFKM